MWRAATMVVRCLGVGAVLVVAACAGRARVGGGDSVVGGTPVAEGASLPGGLGIPSANPEEDRSSRAEPSPNPFVEGRGVGGESIPILQSSGRGLEEVFAFVRVNVEDKVVEFDAEVPAYAYVGKEGVVYLEVVVCTRDTREHEAVLVTSARASDVHAAMLMAGFVPGAPGGWEWKEKTLLTIPPRGDGVAVEFVVTRDGAGVGEPAARWIYNVASGKTLEQEAASGEGFLFTGSGFVTRGGGERYAADGAGTLIGLATFGTETVAWERVFSHESSVDEPIWAVKRDVQPAAGTRVVVRLKRKLESLTE